MDFHQCTGRQYDGASRVDITLLDVDDADAKEHLGAISQRDPSAWAMMFGKNRSSTWTAAGLSDFKELVDKLQPGRLRWVISSGLPLHSNFAIWLNGEEVRSSKERQTPIKEISIQEDLEGIGSIHGAARIYDRQLTPGKSGQFGRSNGFFIRVRGRVINLDDELFGLKPLNHASWPRFALEVDADGLHHHLLSSREGVKECDEVHVFRDFLLKKFNECRSAYEEKERQTNEQLDITALLSDSPTKHVTEPLLRSVRTTVEAGEESFYIDIPRRVEEDKRSEWLATYETEVADRPIDKSTFKRQGANAPALRYDPELRCLVVNLDHPFVDKLTEGGKRPNPAKLFASSEVFLEGQLQEQGVSPVVINSFLRERDRVLRLAAGDAPPTAKEVLRHLSLANKDSVALERAVGAVFRVLGFEYERKGGGSAGPDGTLYARLGRHKRELANYSIVYDTKQTIHSAVPAGKVDVAGLEVFRAQESAEFGFFVAAAYDAEADPDGRLNQQIAQVGSRITLLKVGHLDRLVKLHYHHGITLTELRSLFENARTVPDVSEWINVLERRLDEQGEVPLRIVLDGLDRAKEDVKAIPNIFAVRATDPRLKEFEPDRLIARLKAAENVIGSHWMEVDDDSGKVIMHHTADQIISKLEREIAGLMPEAEHAPDAT